MQDRKEINYYILLIWLGVALALAGVGLIAINLNQTVQREGEIAFHKNLRFISESSAKSVKLFMEGVISEIVFQTQLEVVKTYNIEKVDAAFRSVIFRHDERLSHMILLDGSGGVKVMVTKDPDPFSMAPQIGEFFNETMKAFRVNLSGKLFESPTYRGMAVGMPIFRKLKATGAMKKMPSAIYASGMVMALFSVNDFVTNLVDPVQVEKSGFAWTLTGGGEILASPEKLEAFTGEIYGPGSSGDRLKNEFKSVMAGKNVNGWTHLDKKNRIIQIAPNGDMGEKWVLATSPVTVLDQEWIMAVTVPQSEVTYLLATSFKHTVMLVVFVVVILLASGSVMTRVNRRLARAEEKALLAAELEEKNVSLQAMNLRMDEFVSVVSHDIRSPLNVIKGFLKVIQSSPEGDNFERETSSMLRSCNRLNQLTMDILDISKLEAGKIQLAYDPITIDSIMMESVQTMEFATKEKSLNTVLDLGGETQMEGDSGKLYQVMNNLIGNAVKFTPKGGTITISKLAQNGEVVIKVTDTGPGIDIEDQGIVFSKFEQVRRHQQGAEPGSGLGLSISKGIVELHGGSIGVESAPGKGSTFFVTLPLRKPEPKTGAGKSDEDIG